MSTNYLSALSAVSVWPAVCCLPCLLSGLFTVEKIDFDELLSEGKKKKKTVTCPVLCFPHFRAKQLSAWNIRIVLSNVALIACLLSRYLVLHTLDLLALICATCTQGGSAALVAYEAAVEAAEPAAYTDENNIYHNSKTNLLQLS